MRIPVARWSRGRRPRRDAYYCEFQFKFVAHRANNFVVGRSIKLPWGPREASSNLLRSEAECFLRSHSHFSCPMQAETDTRSVDWAICDNAATTVAKRISNVHSSSGRSWKRDKRATILKRAHDPNSHVANSQFHSHKRVHRALGRLDRGS